MKSSKEKFSTKCMIWNDYISFLAIMFPIVVVLMATIIAIFGYIPSLRLGGDALGPDSLPFFIGLSIICIAIGAIVFYFRFLYISRFFSDGVEVQG